MGGGKVLAIDCGNSRVKWGVSAPTAGTPCGEIAWLAQGAVEIARVAQLGEAWGFLDAPGGIVVANVAGNAVAQEVTRALRRFSPVAQWIAPRAAQCGVLNGYADPKRLGPDRWAALIGARALHQGDCLVVMAGTATTIDVLASNGEFRGGLILPGEYLMKQSLAAGTASLPLASGVVTDFPRATGDAIETGCCFAQLGAIERMYARLAVNGLCLLSGGGAKHIAEHLNIPLRVVDNLVLEGLVRIASSPSCE